VFASKPNVPDYFTSAAGKFRIVSDHLGSPRVTVDTPNGNVVETISYDEDSLTAPLTPFGLEAGCTTRTRGSSGLARGTMMRAWEGGQARIPILFNGKAINLYSYVGNDPVDGIDPVGPLR
jgi:hypothetical protein